MSDVCRTSARAMFSGGKINSLREAGKVSGIRHDCLPAYSMFTARAARIAMVASEMAACSIIRILAQRESTGTSVGEKAVLVLKARNR